MKRASGAVEVVPLEVSGPIVGGRWAGYHEIRADREDTRDVVEQVGDWEMEIIPPDDMDVARTIVGGPLVSLRRPLSRAGGVDLMAALTVEFPQTVVDGRVRRRRIVVAPVTMTGGAPWRRWCGRLGERATGVVVLDAGDVGADPAGTGDGRSMTCRA